MVYNSVVIYSKIMFYVAIAVVLLTYLLTDLLHQLINTSIPIT